MPAYDHEADILRLALLGEEVAARQLELAVRRFGPESVWTKSRYLEITATPLEANWRLMQTVCIALFRVSVVICTRKPHLDRIVNMGLSPTAFGCIDLDRLNPDGSPLRWDFCLLLPPED